MRVCAVYICVETPTTRVIALENENLSSHAAAAAVAAYQISQRLEETTGRMRPAARPLALAHEPLESQTA